MFDLFWLFKPLQNTLTFAGQIFMVPKILLNLNTSVFVTVLNCKFTVVYVNGINKFVIAVMRLFFFFNWCPFNPLAVNFPAINWIEVFMCFWPWSFFGQHHLCPFWIFHMFTSLFLLFWRKLRLRLLTGLMAWSCCAYEPVSDGSPNWVIVDHLITNAIFLKKTKLVFLCARLHLVCY